jgi:RNA polymerase sigma factor (sigma-70 family)
MPCSRRTAPTSSRIWLYAAARRVIANQRRSSRRRVALYERLALDAASASRQVSPADREKALVHEALDRLRPRDREVLLLAEWEGLSSAEIAGALGCVAITARGRLHRARRRFRAVLEEIARDDGVEPPREAGLAAACLYAVRPGGLSQDGRPTLDEGA